MGLGGLNYYGESFVGSNVLDERKGALRPQQKPGQPGKWQRQPSAPTALGSTKFSAAVSRVVPRFNKLKASGPFRSDNGDSSSMKRDCELL